MKILLHIFLSLFIFLTGYSQSGIVINEIMARNASTFLDFNNSYSEGYLEFYNNSDATYYFTGVYLSDDINDLKKWMVPNSVSILKNKHRIIYCNGMNGTTTLQANFKLNPDGGSVYLSKSTGVIIDSVHYGKQYINISYGRYPDGASVWAWFSKGTPGAVNNSKIAGEQLDKAVFSQTGGFYSGSTTIALTAKPGAKIYYTTTGDEPTEYSELYSAPITVSATQVIRARVYEDGFLPGDVSTQTYFINYRNINLPVISISTNPRFFFNDTVGIYIQGTNGMTGYCYGIANWNQDWERPINFEVYDVLKKQQANMYAGTKINGGCSRMNNQKSLGIYFRKIYGDNTISYQFFRDKKNQTEKRLVLRNAGNDWNIAMMRDGFVNTLVQGQLDLDYISYQPSVVFINGAYWGIFNIREKGDEDYVWTNYHLNSDSVDVLEVDNNVSISYRAYSGTTVNYENMIDFLKTNDITVPSNYQYMCNRMDMEEFINYMMTEIFVRNTDWPGTNMRLWCPRQPNGKWRWILMDTDFGLGYTDIPLFNMFSFATQVNGPGWPNPDWSTYLLRTLLKNETFRKEFIDRITLSLATTFHPGRTCSVLDSLRKNIDSEIPFHMSRWSGPGYSGWINNVNAICSFASQRPAIMYSQLSQFFKLNIPLDLSIHSSIPGGSFVVNNIVSSDSVFKGSFFKNSYLSIKSLPPSGYKFKNWNIHYSDSSAGYLVTRDIWKYSDNGVAQSADWIDSSFNDASWREGFASFGYNDGEQQTTLSYGSNILLKHITSYFRKRFNITDTNSFKKLNLRFFAEDGVVIYLNGLEIARNDMPAGPVTYSTLATGNASRTEINLPLDKSKLKKGENIIAAEVHLYSPSADILYFDLAMDYTTGGIVPNDTILTTAEIADTFRHGMTATAYYEADTVSKIITINEICASNKTLKDENGETDGWIELYNPSADTVDAAGMFLTDSFNKPLKFRIPAGYPELTVMAPKSFIRLWADEQPNQGKLHAGISFNRFGSQAGLFQKKGDSIVLADSISFGYQDYLYSYGRYADGAPNWEYMEMTPGKTNKQGYKPDNIAKNILINEICANNSTIADDKGIFNDWVELYNPTEDPVDAAGMTMTDDAARKALCRIPYGDPAKTTILSKGFLVLWCDDVPNQGPLHIDMKLSKNGEFVGLSQLTTGGIITTDGITFPLQYSGYSYGRYTDGTDSLFYMTYTPGAPNKRAYIKTLDLSDVKCFAWPNPSSDFVNIISEQEMQQARISLINSNGELIINENLTGDQVQLNIQNLPAGLYIIQIAGAEKICRLKILKK